ncbi:MAG: HD domain-containing phosphohydrolase, partial [Solirubrobacterales bacterium]
FGAGQPPLRRVRSLVQAVVSGNADFQLVCRDVALRVADMLEIGATIQQALAQCHERWNGRGGPKRLKGGDIRLPARIFHVVHDAEIYNRIGGVQSAVSVARKRAGRQYDPQVAERFCEVAEALFRRLESEPIWDAVLAAEPAPVRWLARDEVDATARSIAKFVDLRSYTLGHSAGVGSLAEATARGLGMSTDEAVTLRRAGLLHDLGRMGVPVAVWNMVGAWNDEQRERAMRHPALTELVLARSSGLGHLGTLAGLHHERLDGSGYRGVTASSLPVAARVLAAADTYHAKLEARPHRPALEPEAAAEELRRQVQRGGLDGQVTEALLEAAGHQPAPKPLTKLPAGLSEREVQVLRLIIRGLSNREMAGILFISPKTVGHHVQHIYDKLGISTRVGATLFALQHGLVEEGSSAISK